MIRAGLRIKHAKLICCFLLFFMCAALPLSVQAVEEGTASPPVSAKVYSEMSENSKIAANLIAGNTFQVIEKVSDDKGTIWYRIRTDFGAEGYVRADEAERLRIDKQVFQKETLENVENSEPDGAEENGSDKSESDEAVSNENVSEENASDIQTDDETNGEVIALANLNLRSMPSARSKIISKVKKGIRLQYFQKIVNDAGESWYQVEYDGMEGYVIAKAVKLVKAQHSDEEKTESETEQTTEDAGSEENSGIEVLSEEILQEEVSVQEEQESEPQSEDPVQFAFAVEEESTAQKEHHQRELDWMLIMLAAGQILCVAAIVVFLMKIRKLRRK